MLATDQLWSSSTELGAGAGPAVDAWRGNQVAVVYQATRPGLAAPLGWVLSKGSIAAMDAALCKQDPVEDLEFGAARDLTAPLDDSPDVVEVGATDAVRDDRRRPGAAAGWLRRLQRLTHPQTCCQAGLPAKTSR